MPILALLRKLVDHQHFQELKEACQGFLEETQDPAILPLMALAHAHLGQRQSAEEICRLAENHLDLFDTDASIDLAAALIVLQRHEEAASLLKRSLDQAPLHPLGLARLGLCFMIRQDLESARESFQKALEVNPEQLPVLNHLATVLFQLKDYQAAQSVVNRAKHMLKKMADRLPGSTCHHYRHTITALQLQLWVTTEHVAFIEEWLHESCANLDETEFIHWLTLYGRLLAGIDRHQQAVEILTRYLKYYPQNVALCSLTAELEKVQGHFSQAIVLLLQALEKDEQNIPLRVQLSGVCLHRLDNRARMAAEKAVELAENLPANTGLPAQALTALAQVESREQNFDTAEALYLRALAGHETFIPALSGLGNQKLFQGKIDEALALFQQVKRIDPVRGHTSLINVRHFPEDTQTLKKMEAASQQANLMGSVQTGILFQLAAAWEKRGEYDKAFDFARRANEACKKLLSYDGRKHRNQCSRIRMGFCRELFNHRPDYGLKTTFPVYVVGMPRSGTTLVEQILAGHSRIFGAGELSVIPQVIQGLNRWERNVGSGRRYPDCVDDLTPTVTKGIADNVLNELKKLAPEARHIVDKLPHNFENIGLIKFLFPNAKIISVRRDPRDIALSNYFTDYQARHNGMGFAYDLTAIGEQLADHNLLMDHWQQVFPGEIMEINYEDIVDNPERCARKMLEYIGVEWEPQVLRFNTLKRPVKTASAWQVRQPVYSTSKAKWRHFQKHLRPLIKGTNAPISTDPYTMLTLPEAGFLTRGVALYHKDDLDGAEESFKKMLHHNPDHAACNYMVGMVYLRKNHLKEGIVFIETALKKAPWRKDWYETLIKACELSGEDYRPAV